MDGEYVDFPQRAPRSSVTSFGTTYVLLLVLPAKRQADLKHTSAGKAAAGDKLKRIRDLTNLPCSDSEMKHMCRQGKQQ